MTPIVAIASHERVSITRQNIESLQRQSVVPKIVLAVSNIKESDFFAESYSGITVVYTKNNPLGAKWQLAVDLAKTSCDDPGPLIITGSDDILGVDYIKNAISLSEEFDFVGLYQWHVWHQGFLYKFDYNARIPLGGGRIYSRELLDKLNWKIFDVRAIRHLDDLGYHSTLKVSSKTLIVENASDYGLHIVAVKGNWPVMNDFVKMLTHPNCSLLTKEKGSETLVKLIGFTPTL